MRSLLGGLRVFVDERMEKNKGKSRERKEKLKRIYDHEARKIRKQVSIAKAKIERLEKKTKNRKITKKGRKNRSQLQKECKTISVAGLISYMSGEKKKGRSSES